ncbi:hypothetical protein FF098_014685 [Parvularcula flava]|uniref:Uncharacterized protein n=1 Tax=Aquisalinus luteolus TaxID=1566827 RepID=A0A8J3A5B2_9PROT|nr:hypothetical protein [Aquisalinus luteolus]NHK29164.1 hypothetical protein [Aquisalinus luteolus]GGI00110.1 hypothetical protein GCM10011355_27630 [Aquisalinus luteolus]
MQSRELTTADVDRLHEAEASIIKACRHMRKPSRVKTTAAAIMASCAGLAGAARAGGLEAEHTDLMQRAQAVMGTDPQAAYASLVTHLFDLHAALAARFPELALRGNDTDTPPDALQRVLAVIGLA